LLTISILLGVPLANQPAQAFWGRALTPYNPSATDILFEGDHWRLNAVST